MKQRNLGCKEMHAGKYRILNYPGTEITRTGRSTDKVKKYQ